MEINQFGVVTAGYAFRGAIKPHTNGDKFVLQAKDLVQDEPFVNVSSLVKIPGNTLGRTNDIRRNDVLLVARGMKSGAFRSTIFASDQQNVVASASIHIIRITTARVLAEYVSYYLNSRDGQDALSQIVSGSYIGALPRSELEKVEIPIPPLNKQEAIVNLHRNVQEQRRIFDRRNEINQNIINASFRTLTTQ